MQEARTYLYYILLHQSGCNCKLLEIVDLHISRLGAGNHCAKEGTERCNSDNTFSMEILGGLRSGCAQTAGTDTHNNNAPTDTYVSVVLVWPRLMVETYLAPSAAAVLSSQTKQ